jgi:glycerol-3-phosphate acyltransferase PlsX
LDATIALDAMGGDHGPRVVVAGALRALDELPALKLVLVGQQEIVAQELRRNKAELGARLVLHHASQRVEMDELPSQALRTKKDSSMRIAINLVKEGAAQACVSAGNTGALMAMARFVLKTLPGIDRPAITSALPTRTGSTHMLDLGANSDCTPEHLLQFGLMGSVLVRAVQNIERPSVGLLNIGAEEIKGNDRVKQAARLLAASDLNYVGYVEGHQIFQGVADVVVCDGFVGNVALKTMEGTAGLVSHYLRQAFSRNLLTRLAGVVAAPALRSLRRSIDPRWYNGASLLGLRGIIIKSHGGADAVAFANAVRVAALEVQKDVPQRISKYLTPALAERRAV